MERTMVNSRLKKAACTVLALLLSVMTVVSLATGVAFAAVVDVTENGSTITDNGSYTVLYNHASGQTAPTEYNAVIEDNEFALDASGNAELTAWKNELKKAYYNLSSSLENGKARYDSGDNKYRRYTVYDYNGGSDSSFSNDDIILAKTESGTEWVFTGSTYRIRSQRNGELLGYNGSGTLCDMNDDRTEWRIIKATGGDDATYIIVPANAPDKAIDVSTLQSDLKLKYSARATNSDGSYNNSGSNDQIFYFTVAGTTEIDGVSGITTFMISNINDANASKTLNMSAKDTNNYAYYEERIVADSSTEGTTEEGTTEETGTVEPRMLWTLELVSHPELTFPEVSYEWTSSNPGVAEISDSGKVRIYGEGNVTFTCTATADTGMTAKTAAELGLDMEKTFTVNYTFKRYVPTEEDIIEGSEDDTVNFPKEGYAGSVMLDKTADGSNTNYSQTGVAKVELDISSVGGSEPIDVVVVIDVSRSMKETYDYACVYFDTPDSTKTPDGNLLYFDYYVKQEFNAAVDEVIDGNAESTALFPVYAVDHSSSGRDSDAVAYYCGYDTTNKYVLYDLDGTTQLNTATDIRLMISGYTGEANTSSDAHIMNFDKMSAMRTAAENFVSTILEANPESRVALVQFADDTVKDSGEYYKINSRIVTGYTSSKDELVRLIQNKADSTDSQYAIDGAGGDYPGGYGYLVEKPLTDDEAEAMVANAGLTMATQGGTNYGLGFELAEQVVNSDSSYPERRKIVVFMTDGEPNTLNLNNATSDSIFSNQNSNERKKSVGDDKISWAYFALRRQMEAKNRIEEKGYEIISIGFDLESDGTGYLGNYNSGDTYKLDNTTITTNLYDDLDDSWGLSSESSEPQILAALRKQLVKNLASYPENGFYSVELEDGEADYSILNEAYAEIAESLLKTTTDVTVTDVIGDRYELRVLPYNNGTQVNPQIVVKSYDMSYTFDEAGNPVKALANEKVMETVTFSGSTLAGGITVTDTYIDENGDEHTVVFDEKISSAPYTVYGHYFTYTSSDKTFVWRTDEIIDRQFSFSYDVYLSNSDPVYEQNMGRIDGEWKKSDASDNKFTDEASAATLDTNLYANAIYTNYVGEYCRQSYGYPKLGWENTSLTVTKSWDDGDYIGEYTDHPKSVTVQLLSKKVTEQNYSVVYNSAVLDESNSWTKTWDNLPLSSDGVALEYSVIEMPVEHYTTNISVDEAGKYVVKNTLITHNVTVEYVDENGNELHNDENPYVNAAEGSDYDVRNVGDDINDYLYPTLESGGKVYYYSYKDGETPESGTLDSDKNIVYVYTPLADPSIEKKIELADGTRVESNAIELGVDDHTIKYVLTVSNPNSIPLANVTVSDVVPDGLTVALGDGYSLSTNTDGKTVVTFSGITVPAAADGAPGTAEVTFTGTLTADVKNGDTIKNTAVITGARIIPVEGEEPKDIPYDITSNEVQTDISKTYNVTVEYVDENGNKLHNDENPYVNAPADSDYDVRNVGDDIDDYLYPTLESGGKVYYYSYKDGETPESGTLDSDKNIVYVYTPLADPSIEKKIELADGTLTEQNAIKLEAANETYTIKYVLTVSNPNSIPLANVTVSDVVPDGLTVALGDGYSLSTNTDGKTVVTFSGITVPAAADGAPGTAEVTFTGTLTADVKNGDTIKNTAVITGATITPVEGEEPKDVPYDITSNEVQTDISKTYNVTVEYVDENGNKLHNDENPYVNAAEGSDYDVRNVGDDIDDYLYPTLESGGKVYYYSYKDGETPESGTLDSDKNIVYVYTPLADPSIEKKIELADGTLTEQNAIKLEAANETYTIKYVLTVSNPNSIPLANVTVSDVVPDGLTVALGDGYSLSTNTDGKTVVTFSGITVPAAADGAPGTAEVTFTGTLTADVKNGDTIKNTAVITGATITPVEGEEPKDVPYDITSNEVQTDISKTYNVTVEYVDENGNKLHNDENPYVNAAEGSDYDVRNVGDDIDDYLYPTLESGGKVYYYSYKDGETPESGTLDSDKNIVYVYTPLADPSIEKKIELADGTRVESNAIELGVDDHTIKYVLTVSNPNSIPLTNVTVSDVVPDGLTAAAGDGYSLSTNTDGKTVVTFSGITVPAAADGAPGTAEVTFTAVIDDADAESDIKLGSSAPYYNIAHITGMTVKPVDDGESLNISYVDPDDEDSSGIPSNWVKTGVYDSEPTISKTADKNTVTVGENVVYTITVVNTARTPLYDVVVTDVIPSGLTATNDASGNCAYISVNGIPSDFTGASASVVITGDNVAANIPCLGIGGSATITLNVKVTDVYDRYDNTAQIDSAAIEIGGENVIPDPITSTETIEKSEDPYITKAVDKTIARVGDTLTYTITVHNILSETMYNVKVSDVIPAGLTLDADSVTVNNASAPQAAADGTEIESAYQSNSVALQSFWYYGTVNNSEASADTWDVVDNSNKNSIAVTIPSIAAGSTAVITFEVTVGESAAETVTNNCSLIAARFDTDDDNVPDYDAVYNKQDSAVTRLIIDPKIIKAVNKNVAGKDEAVTYTLTVSNEDTKYDMYNIVVTDRVPDGLTFSSADNGGEFDPDTGIIIWIIDKLEAKDGTDGSSITLTFTATVADQSKAIYYNTAYITESTPDTDGNGSGDEGYRKEYGDTNHSNTVETDTKYNLIIEYRAETETGDELQPHYTSGGNRGTDYDVDDPTYIPDTIVDGDTVWVKKLITENSSPLSGEYDSDKKIVVVYEKYSSAYIIQKKVSTDQVEWKDSVEVMPGTTVYYKILVTNNTAYPITGLTLSDELKLGADIYAKPGDWENILNTFSGELSANGSWESAVMSFDVPTEASAASEFINTATISDNVEETPDISDNAVVTVLENPDLTISKTANVSEDSEGKKTVTAGQQIAFTLIVTNTGNTVLTNVNVIDDTFDVIIKAEDGTETDIAKGTPIDVIAELEIGGSRTYTVYYNVPVDAYDGQQIVNSATAKTLKEDGTDDLIETDDDTVYAEAAPPAPEPVLSIVKTVDKDTAAPGEYVNYTVTVINSGSVDAENVYVIDYMLNGDAVIDENWAINEDFVIEKVPANGSYVITSESFKWQIPLGAPADTVITNKAELYQSEESYKDGDEPVDEDSADVAVEGVYEIETTKTANVAAAKPGDTVTYTIYVTNKSNAALTDITVTEALTGTWSVLPEETVNENAVNITKNKDNTLTVDKLEAGDSIRLIFNYVVSDTAKDGSDIKNTVTASAEDPDGEPVTDSSEATVRVVDDILVVSKTANCETAYAGSVVTYTVTVTNTGDRELKNVVVTDNLEVVVKSEFVKGTDGKLTTAESKAGSVDSDAYTGKVIGYFETLGAGECRVITVEYTIPSTAKAGDTIVNTAVAEDDDGHKADDSDDVKIINKTEEPTYKLEITKTANVSKAEAGDTVTYTIVVKNSGTGDLHNVSLTDSLAVTYNNKSYPAGNVIKVFETLAAGKSESVVVTYTIPKGYEGSSVVNTASADSDETDKVTSNATVTIENPSISITKSVSSQSAAAGEKVYYTLIVTNTGNVKLTDLVVSDPLVGYSTTIAELDVGERWTSPANTLYYTFASNASSGTTFKNTASVSNSRVKAASSTSSVVTTAGNQYNTPQTGDAAETNYYAIAIGIGCASAVICAVTGIAIAAGRKKRRYV